MCPMGRKATISSNGCLLITNYNLQDNVLTSSKMHSIFVSLHFVHHVNGCFMLQTLIVVVNSFSFNESFSFVKADRIFICFLHLLLWKRARIYSGRIYADGFRQACLLNNFPSASWVESVQFHSFDRKPSQQARLLEFAFLFSQWQLHLQRFCKWVLHLIF